ncbi:MAG: inverse autotransporter beta domain-containing protein [Pseudobdellovibrionaceae bacterium]
MIRILPLKILSVATVVALALINLASARADTDLKTETNDRIQTIFSGLESAGNAYNSNGAAGAASAVVDSGCRALIERFMQTKLVDGLSKDIKDSIPLPEQEKAWVVGKSSGYSAGTMNSLCAALRGEKVGGYNITQEADKIIDGEIMPALMMAAQEQAHKTGIPFLSKIEIEMGVSRGDPLSSVTAIQPLWHDAENSNYYFSQVSYHKANDDKDSSGYKTQHSAYNAGLAIRHLSEDQKYLYGANLFLDHAPKNNHNRMSLGGDFRTSQLAVSANRYFPLSTWRKLDDYLEERAAAGWDLKLSGQVPDLPSWTASLSGYEWDNAHEGSDLFGAVAAIEYSPVPAMAMRMGVRDESGSSPSLEAALRFNYDFSQPEALQFKPRASLANVSDYVYAKVERENVIRVAQRRRAASKITVTETTGANTALETTGTTSLFVGQTILMPATITVANTVGAVANLIFADGAILTMAQNTQVTITPTLITLVTGSIHYVSGSTVIDIVVPGGTIQLLGTDIDVVSNGTNSTARVRDGAIILTGSVSGSATLSVEDMAQSLAGIVGTVAQGSATYETHADQVCSQIDWVADPQTGTKVAPYIFEAPSIQSAGSAVGQAIVFAVNFTEAVTVSGGAPLLNVDIGATPRVATYISGSGTSTLLFSYTIVAGDSGATTATVRSVDLATNSASIMGNGKDAVVTFTDTTVSISVNDITPPSGYTTLFTTDPVYSGNVTAAAFSITGGTATDTYNYTITSSGGGTPVTGSGTITTSPQTISGIDVSGLTDGTLTVSVTLTDASSNTGAAATDTVTKDVLAPTITNVTVPSATYEP